MSGFDLMARLDQLAGCSDMPGLTRLYLSDAHARAVALVRGWMEQAGLRTRLDAAATLIGRRDGPPGAPTLLIGSHLDTVRDAGRYDGALGVMVGLAALQRLAGERLPCAVELLAFGDEEGVRFALTMTGARACAGSLDAAAHLASRDAGGITLGEALAAFGGDPDGLDAASYRSGDVCGFLEVHIEQGPVLERAGLALGVVSAINGCRRFIITVDGEAGHAGTVPMTARRDALAAAAAMIVVVREAGREAGLDAPGVTATVGQIEARPGAINVIAGSARFSLDVRAPDDAARDAVVTRILAAFEAIAAAHGVRHAVAAGFSAPATPCSEPLQVLLEQAAASLDLATLRLPSGAGHDAMVMAQLCPMAMLFVRCAGGISHNPAERITASDAECATRVLVEALRAIT